MAEMLLVDSGSEQIVKFKGNPLRATIVKQQERCQEHCSLYLVACSGTFKGSPRIPIAETKLSNIKGNCYKSDRLKAFKEKSDCNPKIIDVRSLNFELP